MASGSMVRLSAQHELRRVVHGVAEEVETHAPRPCVNAQFGTHRKEGQQHDKRNAAADGENFENAQARRGTVGGSIPP